MADVEKESLIDLEKIVKATKQSGLRLVVIGGYAVIAHLGKYYRPTKDIDFVAPKADMGHLRGLLKGLGYDVAPTEFGLKGTKKLNGGSINLDISVGEVFDISTEKRYPVGDATFQKAVVMAVTGRTEETRKIKVMASVISLEELLLLKLITQKRDKDIVDVISLILDKSGKMDRHEFAKHCTQAGLVEHMRESILNFIGIIKTEKADKIWFKTTGNKLTQKTEAGIVKYLQALKKEL